MTEKKTDVKKGVTGVDEFKLLSELTMKFQDQYAASNGTGKDDRVNNRQDDGTGKDDRADNRQDDGTGKDDKLLRAQDNGTGKDDRLESVAADNGTGKDEDSQKSIKRVVLTSTAVFYNGAESGTGKDEKPDRELSQSDLRAKL